MKITDRGFVGKENQFRELQINTGMVVGRDDQMSLEISPLSVKDTYDQPTCRSLGQKSAQTSAHMSARTCSQTCMCALMFPKTYMRAHMGL